MRIDEVEGIGPTHAAKLAQAGVATTDALLERAPSRRAARPGEATGISASRSSSGSTTST